MSIFSNAFGFLKHLFSKPERPQPDRRLSARGQAFRSSPVKFQIKEEELSGTPLYKCERWLQGITESRKRKRGLENLEETQARKRNNVRHLKQTIDPSAITPSSGNGGGYDDQGGPYVRRMSDRELMPPPTTPVIHRTTSGRYSRQGRQSLDSGISLSEAPSQSSRCTENKNAHDMEAARRRAAAMHLPDNSGMWEPAEKELFLHLAHRGFEPLLPSSWMIDFNTLPISLFATQSDDTPLIQPHISTDFRAIKAFKDLLEIGTAVRDSALLPNNRSRQEPLLEKAAASYIKWALNDLGFSSRRRGIIPVHAIVIMKKGKTSLELTTELAVKMYRLRDRHRKRQGIIPSIENRDDLFNKNTKVSQTQASTIYHDSVESVRPKHQIPVIYGLMIYSSILSVSTLDNVALPPKYVTDVLNKKGKKSQNIQSTQIVNGARGNGNGNGNGVPQDKSNDEDCGLRMIEDFDFSESSRDVWNALVIAIVAMMIRTTMAEVYGVPSAGSNCGGSKRGNGDDGNSSFYSGRDDDHDYNDDDNDDKTDAHDDDDYDPDL